VVTLAEADAALSVGDEIGVRFVNPLFFDVNGDRIVAGTA